MKANVGHSVAADSKTAGAEAAGRAKARLDSVVFAFVYAGVGNNLGQMLAGVREELPGVPLAGNTSFTGVITPAGFVGGDDNFVGVLALADPDAVVGAAGLPKGASARETGRAVAWRAMEKAGRADPPDYFYMAASPGEEEFFLKGITDVIGRVPMFGGSAADNTITGEWSLYDEENVFPDGVVVAFFYTDRPMENLYTGAYRETGDFGVVTKVDGNRILMEIDGVPAIEKYAQWRGMKPDDPAFAGGTLLVTTIASPLGVKDRLGDLIAIRHPMNGNPDGSMVLGAKVAEKTVVIRMEATVDELIATASDTLAELRDSLRGQAAAYHLVHCGGRRAGIGDRMGEVAEAVKRVAGGVPFIMEFTFGEYGFEDDGNNTTGGLMLSYTALCK